MAPEQVAGKKTDHRADIFSLGSVFYELVTREKPFRGDVTTILYKIVQEEPVAPSLINPSIPGGVDAIIRKALAKDPKERFQTCDDMRKAILEQASRIGTKPAVLAPVATAAPSPEQRPSPPLPSFLLSEAPPERSRRVWPALAAVLMLALIATSSWALYVRSRTGTFPAFVNTMMGRVDREVQSFHDLSHRPNPDPGQTPGGGPGSQNSVLSHSDGAGTQPAPNSVALSPAQTAPGISDTPALPSPGNAVKPAGSQPEAAQAPTATSSAPPVPAQVPSTVSLQQISDKQSAATGGATNAPAIVEGSSNSSDSEGSEENHEGSQSSLDTKAPTTLKRPAPRTVDGFTRKNVPDLLRLADVAARRGDYRLARYEYNLVLKLDEGNLTARKGLRLIQAERSLH